MIPSTPAFIPSIASSTQNALATLPRHSSICSPKTSIKQRRLRIATPRATTTPPNHPPDSTPSPSSPPPSNDTPRDLSVLALPMTAGNDVLFPGCNQILTLNEADAQRVLNDILEKDPPEFAYITLNAWNEPGNVGTIGIIDDFQYSPNGQSSLTCSGITRFRLLQFDQSLSSARLQVFHDDPPSDEKLKQSEDLEQRLVSTIKEIVTLILKISDDTDQTRQKALEETLNRVRELSASDPEKAHHWILDLSPNLRRELLSFILIDKLDVSFMDRRSILQSTDTADRMDAALKGLEPLMHELAAKGAIVGALGRDSSPDDSSPPSAPPTPPFPSSQS